RSPAGRRSPRAGRARGGTPAPGGRRSRARAPRPPRPRRRLRPTAGRASGTGRTGAGRTRRAAARRAAPAVADRPRGEDRVEVAESAAGTAIRRISTRSWRVVPGVLLPQLVLEHLPAHRLRELVGEDHRLRGLEAREVLAAGRDQVLRGSARPPGLARPRAADSRP